MAGVTWWLEAIAPYRLGKDFDEPWELAPLQERELREAHRLFTEMGATGHAERVARELGS